MLTADEKLAPESSPVADTDLTLADVDFGDVQKDVLDYMSGKTPAAKQAVVDETPKPADPAPASGTKAPEPEAPKPAPEYLTRADVDRMVKERLAEANKQPPKEDPKPLLSEARFADHDEWTAELAEWTKRNSKETAESVVEQAFTKREEAAKAEREQAAETERRTKSWNDRCEAAKAKIPDFEEITAKGKAIPITEEMIAPLQFMSESPVGPELWVHYIRNETDRNKLLAMSADDQKLELRFMERDLTRNPPPPPAKIVSDAPAPPRSMPGRATSGDPIEDSDEYEPVKARVLKWMKE